MLESIQRNKVLGMALFAQRTTWNASTKRLYFLTMYARQKEYQVYLRSLVPLYNNVVNPEVDADRLSVGRVLLEPPASDKI